MIEKVITYRLVCDGCGSVIDTGIRVNHLKKRAEEYAVLIKRRKRYLCTKCFYGAGVLDTSVPFNGKRRKR